MIPKTFTLGGITWKVRVKKRLLDANRDELRGECDWNKSIIYLAGVDEGKPVPEDIKEQTLYHELIHAILITMDHPLKYDEAFVQTFSTLLHQFEKTKKC